MVGEVFERAGGIHSARRMRKVLVAAFGARRVARDVTEKRSYSVVFGDGPCSIRCETHDFGSWVLADNISDARTFSRAYFTSSLWVFARSAMAGCVCLAGLSDNAGDFAGLRPYGESSRVVVCF